MCNIFLCMAVMNSSKPAILQQGQHVHTPNRWLATQSSDPTWPWWSLCCQWSSSYGVTISNTRLDLTRRFATDLEGALTCLSRKAREIIKKVVIFQEAARDLGFRQPPLDPVHEISASTSLFPDSPDAIRAVIMGEGKGVKHESIEFYIIAWKYASKSYGLTRQMFLQVRSCMQATIGLPTGYQATSPPFSISTTIMFNISSENYCPLETFVSNHRSESLTTLQMMSSCVDRLREPLSHPVPRPLSQLRVCPTGCHTPPRKRKRKQSWHTYVGHI